MISYTANPCPSCKASRGDWCQDHRGITKPGPLLICPARKHDEVLDCPVGLLVGDPHFFLASTGVAVEWDALGEPDSTVTVCKTCSIMGSACLPFGEPREEN